MRPILIVTSLILILLTSSLLCSQVPEFSELEQKQNSIRCVITQLNIAEGILSLGIGSYNNPVPEGQSWQWYIKYTRLWLEQVDAESMQKYFKDMDLGKEIVGIKQSLDRLLKNTSASKKSILDELTRVQARLNSLIQTLEQGLSKEPIANHLFIRAPANHMAGFLFRACFF